MAPLSPFGGVDTQIRREAPVQALIYKLRYLLARLRGVRLGWGVAISRGVTLEPSVSIGARTFIGANAQIGGEAVIGEDCFIGPGAVIVGASGITIGRDCLVAEHVTIRDADHGTDAFPYRTQPMVAAPLDIGENVWIGAKATVLKSVGDNSIVGANAVVTKPIPANSKALGVPASWQ